MDEDSLVKKARGEVVGQEKLTATAEERDLR